MPSFFIFQVHLHEEKQNCWLGRERGRERSFIDNEEVTRGVSKLYSLFAAPAHPPPNRTAHPIGRSDKRARGCDVPALHALAEIDSPGERTLCNISQFKDWPIRVEGVQKDEKV
jgi:hypothetical protein